MMIERHSPEVWRKTAASLRDDASYAMEGDDRGVNRNGAPLLGDTRDLFRPKPSDIPARPGVYKWRDGEGRVIYVGKAKNLRNRLANYFQPLYQLHPRTQTMVLTARSLEWTVVGSSRIYTVLPVERRCSSVASFTRWDSPPDRVLAARDNGR